MPSDKAKNDSGGNDNLPTLEPGQTENTFNHANFANQVIQRENVLWNMIGKNGIKIYRSDSNMVISFGKDDPTKPGSNPQGGNNTSSINHESGSITNYFCNARYT